MSKSIITSLSWGLQGYASVQPQDKLDENKMKEYEKLDKRIKKYLLIFYRFKEKLNLQVQKQ